jgi:hypothetical protein
MQTSRPDLPSGIPPRLPENTEALRNLTLEKLKELAQRTLPSTCAVETAPQAIAAFRTRLGAEHGEDAP